MSPEQSTEPDPGLVVAGLGFAYPGGHDVLDSVDLEVSAGELVVLLGPSACGKTTLLRLIAGLEQAAAGSVYIGGRVVTDVARGIGVPPQRRGVAMVFQDWALLPHLDVAGNITLGMPASVRADGSLLARTLEMVGLVGLGQRRPHELSGGQRQRVAVGRAVAQRPDVLLLDEPFSNLDPSLRERVRGEVHELLRSLGTTTVLVTHDREEALVLADRLALMDGGAVVASGDPVELYRNPPDAFTAGFLGEVVTLSGDATDGRVRTAIGVLAAPDAPDGPVEVMLRPEQLTIEECSSAGTRDDPTRPDGLRGSVTSVSFHGAFTGYRVLVDTADLGDGPPPPREVVVGAAGVPTVSVGAEVVVSGPSGPVHASRRSSAGGGCGTGDRPDGARG